MKREHWLYICSVVAVGMLLFFGGNPGLAGVIEAQGDSAQRTLTVRASAEVAAVPDLATIQLGVHTRDETAERALADNSRQMEALLSVLRTLGIEDRDMQTSRLSVSPVYEYREREERQLVGFQAENGLRVAVRDLDQIGTIIDRSVRAGANRVQGISFSVSDMTAHEDDALRRAVAGAREKAEVLADEAGTTIVGIASIDATRDDPGAPVYREATRAFDTPVLPGEVSVQTSVEIVFEISR